MCGYGCACGSKDLCLGACATHYQNVCDVRVGAAEIPRTLKVRQIQRFKCQTVVVFLFCKTYQLGLIEEILVASLVGCYRRR
jgi:hypothetical protein